MDEVAASPLPPDVPRPEHIFDPVARAMDVVGERWTLVLISHLMGAGRGFQDLRRRTGITPRVLSARLRQLVEAGFDRALVEQLARRIVQNQYKRLPPIIAKLSSRTINQDFRYLRSWGH